MFFSRTRPTAFVPWPGIELLKGSLSELAAIAFVRRAKPALPERIARDIERQQTAGEIIVGWTQASAIVFFAVVYAISPKAFPAGTPFEPVPWTLGIYALFTAGRLLLAYRGQLSRGFVALSVVVDITVLMITIWSFHLQYRAPPAVYLKAPTLMYVFIFIALRTLRFEPGYVLLAGGCAALGWLGLYLYAVWGPDGAAFTHSYVEYVTSHKILRGAEIDKILSILAVTAILGLSLVRARELLARSATEEMAISDLSRFFAPEVAEQIRRAGGGGRREPALRWMSRRYPDDGPARLHRPVTRPFGARADRSSRRLPVAAGAGDPAAWRQHRQISRRRDPGELRRRRAEHQLRS
jgi:adenylate cyclase